MTRRLYALARTHGPSLVWRHAIPLLAIASLVWVVLSLIVAVKHGADRWTSFNGPALHCEHCDH